MNKISIKNAIEFTKKSDKGKISFIQKLNHTSILKQKSGGDYWIRSLSAITKACREDNTEAIDEKIANIHAVMATSRRKQSLDMYKRNLDILTHFQSFRFDSLKPNSEITYLGGLKMNSIISTQGVPLQVVPSLVFKFDNNGVPTIGAILFIAKLDEFQNTDLAIICEALHRNLKSNYGESYEISRDYCTVFDVTYRTRLSHSGMNENKVSRQLNLILKEIKSLM